MNKVAMGVDTTGAASAGHRRVVRSGELVSASITNQPERWLYLARPRRDI